MFSLEHADNRRRQSWMAADKTSMVVLSITNPLIAATKRKQNSKPPVATTLQAAVQTTARKLAACSLRLKASLAIDYTRSALSLQAWARFFPRQTHEHVPTRDQGTLSFFVAEAPVCAINGTPGAVAVPETADKIAALSHNPGSKVVLLEGADHTFNIFSGDMTAFDELVQITLDRMILNCIHTEYRLSSRNAQHRCLRLQSGLGCRSHRSDCLRRRRRQSLLRLRYRTRYSQIAPQCSVWSHMSSCYTTGMPSCRCWSRHPGPSRSSNCGKT